MGVRSMRPSQDAPGFVESFEWDDASGMAEVWRLTEAREPRADRRGRPEVDAT